MTCCSIPASEWSDHESSRTDHPLPLGDIAYYGNEGQDIHGQKAGTAMTVDFELNGQKFLAMNAGPHFKFTEAISLQVFCETQDEIDYFWGKLTDGGREVQCGWLKDKFGLSWQIVPAKLAKTMRDPDRRKSERVMKAFMQMKKYDLAALERAYAGEAS